MMESPLSLIRKYEVSLHDFFLNHVKSSNHAKDFTQDIILKLWIIRNQLPHISNLDGYVFMMAKNRLVDHFRRQNQRKNYKEAVVDIEINIQHPKALNRLIEQDIEIQLHDLLNQLSPRQKEIFKLSKIKGFSHDEIAQKLKISNKTVRNHLFTALKFLREKMHQETLVY